MTQGPMGTERSRLSRREKAGQPELGLDSEGPRHQMWD